MGRPRISMDQQTKIAVCPPLANRLLLPGGSGSCTGDAPTLTMDRVLLLAMSYYIGDPDVINHWTHCRPNSSPGSVPHGDNWCDYTLLAYPGSILLAADPSSFSQHTDQSRAPVKFLGGSPVEALQLQPLYSLIGPVS
jgi:hypothetical protein